MRLELQHDVLQLLEVLFGQVVFAHELELSGVELPLVAALVPRLQALEHGGSHQQVGEDADDEAERPGVLSLHGKSGNKVQVRAALRPSAPGRADPTDPGGGGGGGETSGEGACSLSTTPTSQLGCCNCIWHICH